MFVLSVARNITCFLTKLLCLMIINNYSLCPLVPLGFLLTPSFHGVHAVPIDKIPVRFNPVKCRTPLCFSIPGKLKGAVIKCI